MRVEEERMRWEARRGKRGSSGKCKDKMGGKDKGRNSRERKD